jgi:ubiquinone/menaquinone biosynthesis C-methylase UbiE
MFGIEYSQALTNICLNKNLNVIQGDARNIPFENNTFDAIIMIAVIHHINPNEHLHILNEIKRVLKSNGTCLITNWAVEQPKDSRRKFKLGLNMVTWKGKESNPLPYWVINKEIAEEFIKKLPDGITSIKLTWDAGNWEFWLKKD